VLPQRRPCAPPLHTGKGHAMEWWHEHAGSSWLVAGCVLDTAQVDGGVVHVSAEGCGSWAFGWADAGQAQVGRW
jgi:hypothetical protein